MNRGLVIALIATLLAVWYAAGIEDDAGDAAGLVVEPRTSRSAVLTSSSDSAPCLVSRSKTPERRSERFSNIAQAPLPR